MKTFLVLCLASMAFAGLVPGYDSGSGSSGGGSSSSYGGSSGGSDGYGSETKCTPYYDTMSKDHCESYSERVCTTTQRESCTDVNDQNCRGVVSSKQVRKCFDVTELRCSLKEDVQVQNIQVPVTIQKCHKAQERVCDTLYEASSSTKDKFQCITVNNPTCTNVERTIYDTTCRTTTTFDCDTSYDSGYGGGDSSSSSGGYGDSSTGYGDSSTGGGDGYGSSGDSYGSGSSSGGDYSSTSGYGAPKPNCRRQQDTKCYKTPRTVSAPQCSSRAEKICEKMAENTPFVTPRQSCHNEEKRVCELIERSQSKQVKKYVYTKQCRSVPRKVCENADVKTVVPSCVPTTRKQCSHSPVEQCQDEPKQHCFKISYKVKKQRCEKVSTSYPESTSGYSAPSSSSYSAPAPPSDY